MHCDWLSNSIRQARSFCKYQKWQFDDYEIGFPDFNPKELEMFHKQAAETSYLISFLQIDGLQREIIDLQSEFEFDRIDYLDTIRKQERHIKLLDAIIARIQPCLRRDCNYYNLDRVRTECKWNDEDERWVLPKMVIDRTSLPNTGEWGEW